MTAAESMAPSLHMDGVGAAYGRTVALRDITVTVSDGAVVGILGANGAGKTTLLRVASGLLRPSGGQVRLRGTDVTRLGPARRSRTGLCLIPEGRGIFRRLTVRENLELFLPAGLSKSGRDVGPALTVFPVLARRMKQVAGSLSGGEQQMLAVARAFLCEPTLVLADELSMGLAPIVVDEIYNALGLLNARGVGLLIVEQYVQRLLSIAGEVYVLARGEVVWSGPSADLDDAELIRGYLGDDGY